MRYSCVIFDLDGTLLNTLDDICCAINLALEEQGLGKASLEQVRQAVGNGAAHLVDCLVPPFCTDEQRHAVVEGFKKHYALHKEDTTRPYPGITEMLARLREARLAMAVVSNKPDAAVGPLVTHWFGDFIELGIGEREGIARKPAPDSVSAALKALGADPATSVYVGDSEVDLLTAQAAGLPCISCSWGFRSVDELIDAGATQLVDSPAQLAELLTQDTERLFFAPFC